MTLEEYDKEFNRIVDKYTEDTLKVAEVFVNEIAKMTDKATESCGDYDKDKLEKALERIANKLKIFQLKLDNMISQSGI